MTPDCTIQNIEGLGLFLIVTFTAAMITVAAVALIKGFDIICRIRREKLDTLNKR